MDAITLLKDEHREVEKLFKRFEKAGDRAYIEKRDIVDRIIEALSKHAVIEEQLFYPVTRETVPEVHDVALESLEEHHVVKWLLSELDGMDPHHERFDAKVMVMIENVRHHVEEEEDEYFPKVRDELGRKALGELGDAMEQARKTAPTHPHPRSPDTPPGNVVAGAAAGVADRVGDTVSGLAQGGLAAVQDVIDRVTGSKRSRTGAARGSSTSRRAARTVRQGVDSTLDEALSAVKEAKETGEEATRKAGAALRSAGRASASGAASTAKTAQSEAKRTASTAQGAAKRTKTAAKGAATQTRKTAKRTAKSAKTGAKRTATTARGGAKRTASTAKAGATRTTSKAKRTASTAKRSGRAAATRAGSS